MNDWKDMLQGFMEANPDLPQGDSEPVADTCAKVRKPRLDIILDRKGRAGKTATIIAGFSGEQTDAEASSVASELKRRLATGGSVRGGEILLQGDRRAQAAEILRELGYASRII